MSKSTIKNNNKTTTAAIPSTTVADINKLVDVDITTELEKNNSDNEENEIVDSEAEEDIDNDPDDDDVGLDSIIGEGEDEEEEEASEVEDEAEEEEASEAEEEEASEADEEITEADDDGDDVTLNKKTKLNKKIKKTSNAKGKVNNISGIEMLKTTKKIAPITIDDDEDENDSDVYDDDDTNELYLQKFDSELRENYIVENHSESKAHNYEEVKALSRVVRDGRGIIVDPLHKTNPILTKYEMTRIIGQRAKQLDSGAKAFVKVPLNVIDGYYIAMIELEQKKMPFIIKRPLPNGGVEYWNVSDLEILI